MKMEYFVNIREKFAEKPNKMTFKFESVDAATSFAEVARTAYSGFSTIAVSMDFEIVKEEEN